MSSSSAKKPVPVYLRGLPPEVVREAKAAAARRGVTLAGYVAECLSQARNKSSAATTRSGGSERLQDELRWFQRARQRLSEQYAGQFVAIVDRSVVDHDADFEALAERVFTTYGTRDVLMPQLPSGSGRPAAGSTSKTPLRLRSPRVLRRA